MKDRDVEVVVIEEVLSDARYCRADGIGHCEQEHADERGLILFFDPGQKFPEAAFILREKEVQDEKHPRQGQCTNGDDVERVAESLHMLSTSCLGGLAKAEASRVSRGASVPA